MHTSYNTQDVIEDIYYSTEFKHSKALFIILILSNFDRILSGAAIWTWLIVKYLNKIGDVRFTSKFLTFPS